jgi:hypothetical protein
MTPIIDSQQQFATVRHKQLVTVCNELTTVRHKTQQTR